VLKIDRMEKQLNHMKTMASSLEHRGATEAPLQNIIFDLGGVLVDLTPNRCFEAFRALGVPNDLSQWVQRNGGKGIFYLLEKGEIDTATFCARLRELTHLALSDTAIQTAWNLFLGEIATYKLDCLLELKKEYRLFLLSNTNDMHWDWVCTHDFRYQGHEVDHFFEKCYLSQQMKEVKPNLAIFEQLMDDAAILPQETLFIDDTAANCKAADTLGMRTYQPKEGEDWRFLFEKKK